MDPNRKNTVLFVCAENYEQSRFAEVLFNAEAKKRDLHWHASSKGFAVAAGTEQKSSMSASAVEALQALGCGNSINADRPPTPVAVEDIIAADLSVAILLKEQAPAIKDYLTKLTRSVEFWELQSEEDLILRIRTEVNNLLIKLIIKSGKRPGAQSSISLNQVHAPKTTDSGAKPGGGSVSAAAVRVSLEKKGRRGKQVTTVTGLPLLEDALVTLGGQLKQTCGSGGTVKDGVIEVQGDHVKRLLAELEKRGYKPKRKGG